jgi:hypothetical protein
VVTGIYGDWPADFLVAAAINKIHPSGAKVSLMNGNLNQQKEVNMRYVKPVITSTAIATAVIQGDKNGLPNDSNGIDPQTVGAAYPVDE